MIRGMTGFGTSTFFYKGKKYLVSVKSVNHKFLDYVFTLPNGFFSLEARIKKELSRFLHRGRITFQLSSPESSEREPVLNKHLLFKYSRLIQDISRSLNMEQDINLGDILALPDVICFRSVNEYSNRKFLSLFNKALHSSIEDLVLLRKKEGKIIYADSLNRTRKINQKLKLIKVKLVKIIEEQKTKLDSEELKEFLKNYNIEEEIVRLEFHVKTFKATLSQSGPLGKILDFITQEMQREINTLSAKFRDAQVSFHSVVIKDEIEKLREQLQNVE
ncbi:MAG: DUF1732 domain-containing protein [Candidatus Omnitrophica bacterium]|nr:DUF1732 domain-containing protein [Candidatus Omnitrophota bacterium]MDD5351602.1 DUF1732 domain-containing protein [Candidatus Omnitrophota bacterium]MDD5550811.1 DUF1732 domain-containing protein [Candidatus Omnitrophota bacterium]